MSYEAKMLEKLAMPTRKRVEQLLLQTLFKHGGVIKEFRSGDETVREMADQLMLSEQQRSAFLETIYRKDNRVKKALLTGGLESLKKLRLLKAKGLSTPRDLVKTILDAFLNGSVCNFMTFCFSGSRKQSPRITI